MNNRNVEIKARLGDVDRTISRIKQLSNFDDAVVIKQHDTFFKVTEGRLKIRRFEVRISIYEFVYDRLGRTMATRSLCFQNAAINTLLRYKYDILDIYIFFLRM